MCSKCFAAAKGPSFPVLCSWGHVSTRQRSRQDPRSVTGPLLVLGMSPVSTTLSGPLNCFISRAPLFSL